MEIKVDRGRETVMLMEALSMLENTAERLVNRWHAVEKVVEIKRPKRSIVGWLLGTAFGLVSTSKVDRLREETELKLGT